MEVNIAKKLLIALGITLICGVLAGLIFKTDKYFVMYPSEPKREITKELFESIYQEEPEYVLKEDYFNFEKGMIFGISSLGIVFLVLGLRKTKP